MKIQDILRTIQYNFNIAFILIAILAILLGLGYFIIYKKILKGGKALNKRKVIIWFCFIGYIIMVIGVTFLNRGARIFGDTNLQLFSSYKEAWNSFGSRNWKFIILNIFMLVPLGTLLPLIDKRFRKFPCLFAAAFLMTLTIETVQLITGYGIFELDDIFNNVLGAIIGYGIVMTIITIVGKKENKFKRSVLYLIPLILVVVSSISIVSVYNSKEFGNLYIAHNYKINMKNIAVSLNTEIEDETQEVFLNDNKYSITKVPIYKAPIYDKHYGEQLFRDFVKDKNIDEEIEVDSYDSMAIYWFRSEGYNMSFNYNGGNYDYRDFSSFDEGVKRVDRDKETIVKELETLDITIPEVAVFNRNADSDQVGIFEWDVENYVDGEYITNGRLSAEYYNDHTIKGLGNNIIKYKKVRNVSIKSKKEAYKELEQGKFNLYKSEGIRKIEVEDISLSYALDSKGFYQPIYNFKLKIDGIDTVISIPAL